MKIAKVKAIENLRRLEQNQEPILFSISDRGWPCMAANGQGSIQKISDEELMIEGRDGKLFVSFGDDYEYEISGHYPRRDLHELSRPGSSNRVRCITIRNKCAEAHLVFRASACSRHDSSDRRRNGLVVRSIR